jgi:aerobic carbon-monoxide dehydrogenase medium subunit
VKPPPFLYARPRSLAEAVDLLGRVGDDGKVLAGGQSLVPLLNFRLARPSVLIDLALISELSFIRRAGGWLEIGAMTRQRTVELSEEVRGCCRLIPDALRHVGHLQIRNRGTVGGSLAHADPAAELPAVAVALGAELVLVSARGERTVQAREFFVGPFMTALGPDEVLTAARFPAADGARTVFLEFARRSGDFALGGVAASVRFAGGSRSVEDLGMAALGMGSTPIRLAGAEAAVRGRALEAAAVEEAGAAASAEVEPFTDTHADSSYRRDLIGTLVRRALSQVAAA